MRRSFALLLTGLAIAACAGSPARAEGIAGLLPLLTADLKGVYTPVERRALEWRLAWSRGEGGALRAGEAVASGADLALRIALDYETATGRLHWKVTEGRIELGPWLQALATRPDLSAALTGIEATGAVLITGEGDWADGALTGTLKVSLNDATVRNDTRGWRLEGVALHAGGDAADWRAGRVPVSVAVRTITTARFGARAFSAEAVVEEARRVEVKSARVEIAGGEVTAEPFGVTLAEPSVDVSLVMRRVGLQDLIVFVPTVLAEASGRINGRLRLGWSPADGVRVGTGELSLEAGEPTSVRLMAAPSFLTKNVPLRLKFLPPKYGLLADWFSSPNDAYATLSDLELGKISMSVESLEVRLTPDGDGRGRSASATVRARPQQAGGAVGLVTFEINVAGPLASVLRMGMKQGFSVQTR